jgi:hypothetical protein
MAARFRYADDEWKLVSAQLARLGAPTAEDRGYLEDAARDYLWLYNHTDPAGENAKAAKASSLRIATYTAGLIHEIDELRTQSPVALRNLEFQIARDPQTARAEFDLWLQQTREMARWAERSGRGWPKSMAGRSNRARSDVQEDYLRKLLEYWERRGGHAGKSTGSPAVKFILAAARPVIPSLKASTVSHFIRDEIDVVRPRRALQLAPRK